MRPPTGKAEQTMSQETFEVCIAAVLIVAAAIMLAASIGAWIIDRKGH